MDNLTHTLTGFALAQAGLGRLSPGATLAALLASKLRRAGASGQEWAGDAGVVGF